MDTEERHSRRPGWLARYGFAAMTIVAVWFIMRIPVVGPGLGGLFFLAFLLNSWYGGVGPGLFSVAFFEVIGVGLSLSTGKGLTSKNYIDMVNIFLIGGTFPILIEGLHRARRRAEAARHWLSTVLTSIGDAVIATDAEGRVMFMNAVAESLCGWTAAEAAGRPLEEAFHIVNERTRDPVESPVRRVLAEGVIVGLANHTVLISRGGDERPIDDSAAPIRGPDGRLDGVALVFRDVTERRAGEARLADEARRKDEFLAMLSHELRNPLAAVSNAVQLLAHPDDGEAHAWACEVLARQTRQLTRLVDDLLDVSRISRGKIRLEPRRVDLSALVGSAADVVRPLIEARGHHLRLSVPDGPIEVDVDPARLEQVVVNLLNNAAKYTEPGGRIEVEARREGGEAMVRVVDTGIGIAPDLLPRVFELFAQGDRSMHRSEGGLGIGLSMVHRLVEMHGGRVEVQSEGQGQGSTFTVRLPLATEAEVDAG